MPINTALKGKKYGPTTYVVGLEKAKEYALAVGGGIPSTGFMASSAPDSLHPWFHDEKAAQESPYGGIVAMPSFAVVFAMGTFGQACADPALGIDLLRLVHGEQEFEWFGVIRPGDVMTTTGTLTEVYSKAGKDFFVVTTESTNQRGELVVRGTWLAVIRAAL